MSDLISRQEAIDVCNKAIDLWQGQLGEGIVIAVRKKIEELPSAQPREDTISRQAAIDAVMRNACNTQRIYEAIKGLPSEQPERKRGKWIYNSPVTMKCDQCGLVIKDWDWHRFKFCPNCDCDMRGE